MYHYTYKLELPETNEYYFGSRTSKVEPTKDIHYLGSMKSWKPDKKKLIKTIIKSDFSNREECVKHERELIIEHRTDKLNKNGHIPGVGFNTLGLGQYVDSNGKIYRISKEDELVKNGILLPFWVGKKHNEESKKKMSSSALGKKLSDVTKKKMSEFHKGKKKSEETKQKMRDNAKENGNNYIQYLKKTGLSHAKSKKVNQYSLDGEFIKEWENTRKAAQELGVNNCGLNNCVLGKTKSSAGFIWKYI
jgi:hypothetical protein